MSFKSNLVNIVLVETSHPGNIGSVARAMKTMGLCNLSLVNPRKFPSGEANALSGNAPKGDSKHVSPLGNDNAQMPAINISEGFNLGFCRCKL